MTPLERRILDISFRHELSHIGSCLTSAGIIDSIYARMGGRDKFVLSCGHAGLALYCVLEKYILGRNAEDMLIKHGIHPNLDLPNNIDCSTGSLGQGICIALGIALADRSRNVYCLLSDGEVAEGSVYEALNVVEKYHVDNLKVYINFNGYSAYDKVEVIRANKVHFINTKDHWFMKLFGQEAHYKILTQQEYYILLGEQSV